MGLPSWLNYSELMYYVNKSYNCHKIFIRGHSLVEKPCKIIIIIWILSPEIRYVTEMDPVKIAGVAEWPIPNSKQEVQSFLGFTNFYRWFIEGFSHLARPLFDLTQNNSIWHWTETENTAFDHIRTRITSAPILMFPDETWPFRVEADSSDFAIGAMLSQQSLEDDKWHPIAYYSKSLNVVERYYEIHDKEMLAVIRALEEWRHFLEGARHKFEIWTDHKNLEYFMSAKKLNRRQVRWSL